MSAMLGLCRGLRRMHLRPVDTFARRHIGPRDSELPGMLATIGVDSLEDLISKTIPGGIRTTKLNIPAQSESEALSNLKTIMAKNKILNSFIGAGYYGTHVPAVILRNMLENPGWYTPYTPYQAEISQGRLEMLLNFQTMVADLCGMPVANASLLDEATAAGEAAVMCFNLANKKTKTFIVAAEVHPQVISVVKTRGAGVGLEIVVKPTEEIVDTSDACGVLLQYPDTFGNVSDFSDFILKAHAAKTKVVVATDLLALTLLTPPGEIGADIVVGSAQRFGVPMGFGGPHAGFLATQEEHKRKIPGRIIGVSRDCRGEPALRMAMQTREQHIRRDRATSNICTAQALLANTSAAYGIFHGPEGLKTIAKRVHGLARIVEQAFKTFGLSTNSEFFDTVAVTVEDSAKFVAEAEKHGCNIRVHSDTLVSVSIDETTSENSLQSLVDAFAVASGSDSVNVAELAECITPEDLLPAGLARTSDFMTHPVFNTHHSETEMMRYLFQLQSKDLSLQTAMIPLGSCTMKLNAASEMIPVTWNDVGNLHPFAPVNQVGGYSEMLAELGKDLVAITGFDDISFQPNSGAQGEYAGLLAILKYHESRNEPLRKVCLIPVSAHGTNPASAALAGMKVVVIKCDKEGNTDLDDLKAKAEQYKDTLAAAMITYPSTHGVFEETIVEFCDIIHQNGGQVYMDGANMNAQVGICSPGDIGADVCHLNLHKTFCIPHGGGGPGMGPIGVKSHLAPFLPSHVFWKDDKQGPSVAGAPFSSASILPISYMFIKMMGSEGLLKCTQMAIANANYMAKRLEPHFKVLFRGKSGFVAHEFILDMRPFKTLGILEEDVAKRLMDYNFHGPTMSWPVPGTLMTEPTESEPLKELDRYCDALIQIRKEISEIEDGTVAVEDSVLKGAPHTADMVLSDSWNKSYPREKAAYPLKYLRQSKFWPTVGRVDNVFGDRNVVCACPPIEDYM